MTPAELELKLLRAHAHGDGSSLAKLYAEAAAQSESAGLIDEACFRYTQAYVFALESGLVPLASTIREKLQKHGREE